MNDLKAMHGGTLRAIVFSMIQRAERDGREELSLDDLCDEVLREHAELLAEAGDAMARRWIRLLAKDVLRKMAAHLFDEAPRMQLALPGLERVPVWATITIGGEVRPALVRRFTLAKTRSHLGILRESVARDQAQIATFLNIEKLQVAYPAETFEDSVALAADAMV
jgi:hypothetical protein